MNPTAEQLRNRELATGIIVPQNTGTAVNAGNIATTQPAVIPPPPTEQANSSGIINSLATAAQGQVNTAIEEAKPIESETAALTREIKSSYERLQGKLPEQQAMEQNAGIIEQQKGVKELSNQLDILSAETTAQKLATEGRGEGIPLAIIGGQQRQIERQNAIKALTISAALQAKQGNLALAQDQITRSLDMKYKPIEDEINYKMKLLDMNKDRLTAVQRKVADAQSTALNLKLKEAEVQRSNQESIGNIYTQASSNNAPNSVLSAIQSAMEKGDTMTAIRLGAPYAKSAVDEAYKVAQTNKIKAETAAMNKEIAQSGGSVYTNVDVNKLASIAPADVKNGEAITAIIRSNAKIGQGTKTNLSNLLGVVASVRDMAANAKDGEFVGLSPFRNITDLQIPFTNIGLPFREAGKRQETIANETLINGINLRTQVWASGAALTAQQTKQVEQMTPKVTDTDAQVKTKLNELTNFMLTQAKSVLQSEGVNFTPEKVDLFDTDTLINKASGEQLKELQAAGLI